MSYAHTRKRKVIKRLKKECGFGNKWLGEFHNYMATFRKEKKRDGKEGQEAEAKAEERT
jgi:hypothetical protein